MTHNRKKESTKWTSVNILSKTIEEVRKLIPKLYGFNNAAEYVQNAVRLQVEKDLASLETKEIDELE